MTNKNALLIIDVQQFMFSGADKVFESTNILKSIQTLLHHARSNKWPVVFVQHNGGPGEPEETGSEGWQLHPGLQRQSSEPVIQKFAIDGFDNTELQAQLKNTGAEHFFIAGMQSDQCVVTNTRKASILGFDVTLVSDAHSTVDSRTEKAPDIIARINAEVAQFAKLITVDKFDT
jgi:nicotinamidase-related amidase